MAFPRAPDFPALLARLAEGLRRRDIPFMLIGGQAVLLHGRPRLTEDVDVTLAAGPDRWSEIAGACEELGLEVLPEDAERFVRETFVLPFRRQGPSLDWDYIDRWAREFGAVPGREDVPEKARRLRGVLGPGRAP